MSRDGAVRWVEDSGWEARCERCASMGRQCFWPLTLEFWYPRRGMKRCIACLRELDRIRFNRRYREDPEFRAARIARIRDTHQREREVRRVKQYERYLRVRNDPERWQQRLAYQREWKARRNAA